MTTSAAAEPRPLNLDKSQVLTLRQTRRLTLAKEIKGEVRTDPQGRTCVVDPDWHHRGQPVLKPIRCPWGEVGARHWVREQWWHLRHNGDDLRTATYCADSINPEPVPVEGQRWVKRPPSSMPSWASRFALVVEDVRVVRASEESPWYWQVDLRLVDA